MPEYIEDIAREHARRVGSPGFIARPGERTYNIYPEGLGGRTEEYWPTTTGGVPDFRSMSIKGEYVPTGEFDIEDMPQRDYALGRTTIRRQFMDDMRMADGFKALSPETYMMLAEEARMTMQSRLSKLQMKLDKSEMQFKQIRENPNFSMAEQEEAKMKFYDSNPVWQAPRTGAPMTVEEQLMAGAMAGVGEEELPAEEVPEQSWWQRLWGGKKEPEVRPIIGPTGQPITAPTREAAEVLPTTEQIAEYRRLGGRGTEEGRRYAREFGGPAERRPVTPTAPTTPPKPIGYADAVWNEKYRMWTVFKNGKLVGLQEE